MRATYSASVNRYADNRAFSSRAATLDDLEKYMEDTNATP
jgi:hypothetical protein